jgi:hypothetical protein
MSTRSVLNDDGAGAVVLTGLQTMILLVCISVMFGPVGRAQAVSVECSAAQTHRNEVLSELRKLRIEILEYRIESRTENVAVLEQALTQVRSERLRFENEERVRVQQMAEAETYLATQAQTLSPEQRMHFEGLRAGLMAEHPERLRAEHATLEKREAEAEEGLRAAHRQLEQLKANRNELIAR